MATRCFSIAASVSSGSQLLSRSLAFSPAQHLEPGDPPAAAVRPLHRGVEHPLRGAPDVGTRAVALDEGNDRLRRHAQPAILHRDRLAVDGSLGTSGDRRGGGHGGASLQAGEMTASGRETTLNLAGSPGTGNRAGGSREAAAANAIHTAHERWIRGLRGDHRARPRALRAARLAWRPGRRDGTSGALSHSPRWRRGGRARHPGGCGPGADALGRGEGAARGGHWEAGPTPSWRRRSSIRSPAGSSARSAPTPRSNISILHAGCRAGSRPAALSTATLAADVVDATLVRRDSRGLFLGGSLRPARSRRGAGGGVIRERLADAPDTGPVTIDMLRPAFFRNKGAYLVGRMRRGGWCCRWSCRSSMPSEASWWMRC